MPLQRHTWCQQSARSGPTAASADHCMDDHSGTGGTHVRPSARGGDPTTRPVSHRQGGVPCRHRPRVGRTALALLAAIGQPATAVAGSPVWPAEQRACRLHSGSDVPGQHLRQPPKLGGWQLCTDGWQSRRAT